MANEEKEWQRFRVGKLSTKPDWTETNCQPLLKISHVAHLNNALNIFQSGKINAGLVFDKSLLNKDRVFVVWLSPNDWEGAGGFRYGNIRFTFDWKKIIDGMNSYWIESMAYGIEAPRILLTSKNYDGQFYRYNPTIGDGPWWFKSDINEHYWNGHYCLEILIERDINLTEVEEFDFVNHHEKRCSIDPYNCPDLGLSKFHTGPKFICSLVGLDNDDLLRFFKNHQNEDQIKILKYNLSLLWMYMLQDNRIDFSGNITSKDKISLPLARAILDAYAHSRYDELDLVASLFKSQKSLRNSCSKLIGKVLNIEWQELLKG